MLPNSAFDRTTFRPRYAVLRSTGAPVNAKVRHRHERRAVQ